MSAGVAVATELSVGAIKPGQATIYLVQHGKAKTEEEDEDRPLTAEGA